MPRGKLGVDASLLEAALIGYQQMRQEVEGKIAGIRRSLGSSDGAGARPAGMAAKPKRTLSAAARGRIAAAQRKRWALAKAKQGKPKRTMSASARRRISAAQKKRWAVVRAKAKTAKAALKKVAKKATPKSAAQAAGA